jgi:hypothetical protein
VLNSEKIYRFCPDCLAAVSRIGATWRDAGQRAHIIRHDVKDVTHKRTDAGRVSVTPILKLA